MNNYTTIVGQNDGNIAHMLYLAKQNNKKFDKLCYLWWAIWEYRNKVIFRNENLQNIANIKYEMIRTYDNWQKTKDKPREPYNNRKNMNHVSWKKTSYRLFKIELRWIKKIKWSFKYRLYH